MNHPYTPELAPDVLDRLASYAGLFRGHFKHAKQATYCSAYPQGLLLDGERKSIEPMPRRVHLPDAIKVADLDQALQQFLGQSPWDDRAVMATYRSTMARRFASPRGVFIANDTGLPRQGKHSVGVAHQYCGALGKRANCQVAASLHYVGPGGDFPLAMRLYLPRGGSATPSGSNGPACRSNPGRCGPRAGSSWNCSTKCVPRGWPGVWSSSTPATAFTACSGTAWPSVGCTTSSG